MNRQIKQILILAGMVFWALQLGGCMTVSEHKNLMAAQQTLYVELESRYSQLKTTSQQCESDLQRDQDALNTCRSDSGRCELARTSLEQQLKQCNSVPVTAVDIKDCGVVDIRFEAIEANKPALWLRDFKVPALRIRPEKDGISDNGEQRYWLSSTQLETLNDASKDLIRNVEGWQIWYREVVEQPVNSLPEE